MRRFIYLPFVLLMSCAPDERMPLSDCDYGLYWAECGGSGEPVLGCDRGNGDCRWFAGGVTARGYAVADKPVLGACPEGWPFSDFGPNGALRERVVQQMGLLSNLMIAPEGANDIPVLFDLTGTTTPGLVLCGDGCSSSGLVQLFRVGTAVVVRRQDPYNRWELEILAGTMPSAAARVYRTQTRVVSDRPLGLGCGESFGREVLMSGTLHLNTDDLSNLDALHGRVEGVADRGEAFTFEF